MKKLSVLKEQSGECITSGLRAEVIEKFLDTDPRLSAAISLAERRQRLLLREYPEFAGMPEAEMISCVQQGLLNFYGNDAVMPYVPLAAKGPWVVSFHGAVIFDLGGYGMLGLGHSHDAVTEALGADQVMANLMTPSVSQYRFIQALKKHIGLHRTQGNPYEKFNCMNSGSEAMAVAGRIVDAHAKLMTDPGAPHAGKKIVNLAVKKGFHGRTEFPARVSDSSAAKYSAHLASFRENNLLLVEPDNVSELEAVFSRAAREGLYIQAMVAEPVQGEGNPGAAMSAEFYRRARELTRQHGTFLIIDSIQAGFRAHGVLSVTDYPGFRDLEPPDMESFSKAINAGQYPLSILALTKEAAACYKSGIYGNTMTTNPRALDVASAVFEQMTPAVSKNIVERGREFKEKLQHLQKKMPQIITSVQGTGLLVSAALDSKFPVEGKGGVEEFLRRHGLSVIHGGKNALRFTPYFLITSEEIDFVISETERNLRTYCHQ